jgi:hypothetical protein
MMPEFILDYGTPEAALRLHKCSPFVQGYIEAMFFTDASDPDDGDLADATVADLAPETLDQIISECEAFQEAARFDLAAAYLRGYTLDQAGRDFWYTRNGHGVGFWDRPLLRANDLGDKLTDLCGFQTAFPDRSICLGDDGQIYMCEG